MCVRVRACVRANTHFWRFYALLTRFWPNFDVFGNLGVKKLTLKVGLGQSLIGREFQNDPAVVVVVVVLSMA